MNKKFYWAWDQMTEHTLAEDEARRSGKEDTAEAISIPENIDVIHSFIEDLKDEINVLEGEVNFLKTQISEEQKQL